MILSCEKLRLRSIVMETLTATPPASPLGWPIALGAIDAGLRELWKEHETATRASLMNLVIIDDQEGWLEAITPVIHQVILEHACRVILIEAAAGESDQENEAWITAHCSLDAQGNKGVCCEQLAFRLPSASPARWQNILFANLESDLPLVLWWRASFGNDMDVSLFARVERLLIDSQSWSDPETEWKHLTRLHRTTPRPFIIHDLSWTRTFHLRKAIAACFEEETAVSALSGLQKIRITHLRGMVSTAAMLGGWIAHRLRGRCVLKGGELVIECGDATIPLQIVPSDKVMNGQGPAIDEVVLTTAAGEFRVACSSKCAFYQISTTAHQADHSSQLLPSDGIDLAGLLIDQLGRGGNNRTYLDIVSQAAAIIQGLTPEPQ